jgi:hypothetical protein
MAQHRTITLAEETISWMSASGTDLAVIVRLTRTDRDYFEDGSWEPVAGGMYVSYIPVIAGKAAAPVSAIAETNHPVARHAIGKIGLTDERYAEIMAAKDRVESHPAWQAKIAATRLGVEVETELEAHRQRVENVMTSNGGSM